MSSPVPSPVIVISTHDLLARSLARALALAPGLADCSDSIVSAGTAEEVRTAVAEVPRHPSGQQAAPVVALTHAGPGLATVRAALPEAFVLYLHHVPTEPIEEWSARVGQALELADRTPTTRWTATTASALTIEPQNEMQRIFAEAGLGWLPAASTRWVEATAGFGALPEVGEMSSGTADLDARGQGLAPEVTPSLLPETDSGSLTARDNRLGRLLASLGSSLLVSTYQTNRVISLRPVEGGLGVHLRAFDRPMGIALTRNGIALATRQEIIDFRNLPAAAAKLEPAGSHDACLLPRNSHTTGDIAAHDLGVGHEGLWVVATQFSCLATLDEEHSFVPRWQPPFISALAPEDRCHLNGMAMVDGEPRFVTALGISDTAGGWRPDKATSGVVMAVPSGEVVVSGLSMPHSPRWHRGTLYVLESGRGHLVACNPATGERRVVAALPGFTRGLSLHDNLAFIGTSQIRETATFGGLPIAEQAPLVCGVWAVDLDTGEVVASVRFEDRVQEIFDVAFLPGVRHPEIGEPGSELVRTSWEVPAPVSH